VCVCVFVSVCVCVCRSAGWLAECVLPCVHVPCSATLLHLPRYSVDLLIGYLLPAYPVTLCPSEVMEFKAVTGKLEGGKKVRRNTHTIIAFNRSGAKESNIRGELYTRPFVQVYGFILSREPLDVAQDLGRSVGMWHRRTVSVARRLMCDLWYLFLCRLFWGERRGLISGPFSGGLCQRVLNGRILKVGGEGIKKINVPAC
jgi:hypothetical protein